jgi:hypothetical protein
MVKNVLMDDNIHERLIDLQDLIKEKYKVKFTLASLIDKLIENPEKTAEIIIKREVERLHG